MKEIISTLNTYYQSFLASVPRIALALFILVCGVLLINWISGLLRKRINKNAQDKLMSNFLASGIKTVFIISIILLALHAAGLSSIAAAILATAGASAVVIGFAFKDIAENFLAGIILAFNRPFQVNDTVQIEDIFGKVKSMEFRYTKISTFDGRNVYIPNADILTKPVTNFTEDGFFRSDFIVGIAYENEIEKAKEIITQCIEENTEVVKDSIHVNFVVEDELAASTVNLKAYFWVNTEDFRRGTLITRGKLIQNVKTRLEAAGFNLPANITELKFYDGSKSFSVKNDPER